MSDTPAHPKACPACAETLVLEKMRLNCRGCGGTFIDGDELGEMLLAATDRPEIEWADNPDAPRRSCPLCETRMHLAYLWKVPVERCGVHGTWFDAGELQKLLDVAGCPAEGGAELPDARPRE